MKTMRKRNIIFIFVILLLCISIGFAYINGLLKINGIANVSKQTWDVYFDNVQVTTGSVTPISAAQIVDSESTKVAYSVELDTPGDFYEFTVDAVNNGSIDAMISSVEFMNKVTVESQYDPLDGIPEHIRYSITYADGVPLGEGHILPKKEGSTPTVETYRVRIEFSNDIDITTLNQTEVTNLTLNFEVMYEQADDTAIVKPSWLTVGSYFTMVPDSSSYQVLSLDSGYNTDQTITPNELTLWRVIGVNNDGTVDAISDQVSSNSVYVYGAQGYANYVNLMQTIAQQYKKTGYTKAARMFGYDGQTLTIPSPTGTCDDDECKNNTTYPFEDSTTSLYCPVEASYDTPTPKTGTGEEYNNGVVGDSLYLKDYLLVKNAYSDYLDIYSDAEYFTDELSLMAPIVNTEITRNEYYNEKTGEMEVNYYGANYYIASRSYSANFGCQWEIRFAASTGGLNECQHRYYWNGWYNNETNYHLRPIVTVNANVVKASGDGTKANPYTFQ